MMGAIAPFWDGNETWLVLVGARLFAAFPMVYAIFLPAFYLPIWLMLFGIAFRGVAFEFRERGDAAPLVSGRAEEIVIVLLPTAWRFSKASRIRLAIAGADADNYGQVPHGGPPVFTINRDRSFFDLPCLPIAAALDRAGTG
jgi:hypothetical protein